MIRACRWDRAVHSLYRDRSRRLPWRLASAGASNDHERESNVGDYAGELALDEAWALLRDDEQAVLIDVRTQPEWLFVGVPVLDELGKQPRFVEWSTYPDGAANGRFLADAAAGIDQNAPVLFLCRSGARSLAAARAFAAAGYSKAYNVSAGFEGDLDANGQRRSGWRHAGLPWRQR